MGGLVHFIPLVSHGLLHGFNISYHLRQVALVLFFQVPGLMLQPCTLLQASAHIQNLMTAGFQIPIP